MKRDQGSKLLRLMVMAVLAGTLSVGLANAQELEGKFTLPFEVHWGLATLPAGNYSFTVKSTAADPFTVWLSRGTRGLGFIYDSQGYNTESSGPSELTVVRDETGNTVREMRLPAIGVVLYYAQHKSTRAPEERAMARVIPVTTEGK